MHTVKLYTGALMPATGLGLWKVDKDTCAETVYQAIKAGYRLLDGASDYGNEVEAGQGLKRAIDEGIVKREDMFITTKLWNTFHKAEHVATNARRQLKDWQLEYFDLYEIHFPISLKYVDPAQRYPPGWTNPAGETEIEDTPIQETWQAMEKLVDEGLVKHIGISNFMCTLIMDLLRYARIKPAVLQVEMHPYHVQQELVNFCKAFNIAVTAFSSFGPQSWIELDHPKVKLCTNLFEKDVVVDIAKKHERTPAQVLLRWATQRGIAVIPKSNNVGRLSQNLEAENFDLSEEEIASITKLDVGLRFNNPAMIDARISIFS
ncbi:D-xylose reductase [Microbotryomycetes sp. JL221]|nr:D-xylose reductase [Microbotryomycetes sp. JL221]